MKATPEDLKSTVARYTAFFESASPESLHGVLPLLSPDIHFIDPFNDVHGHDAFIQVFEKMYQDVEDPEFEICEEAWGDTLCILLWRMSCRQRHLGAWSVSGVTELRFDTDGLIRLHRDYWDAGGELYARLPIVGPMVRFVRRRLTID